MELHLQAMKVACVALVVFVMIGAPTYTALAQADLSGVDEAGTSVEGSVESTVNTISDATTETIAAEVNDKTTRDTASRIPAAVVEEVEEDVPMGPPPGVEVMAVKGRAVSGIETDVPDSVTQFDADTIAALGAGNIADLAKVTPNVEIRTAGATTATFFIRGVGLSDFSSNAAGAVAIYQDDVPLNAPAIQLGQLFDTLTVDVKRGPQGTGLFRNASAGAIMIYGNKPSMEYEAKIVSSTSSFWTNDAKNAFTRDTQGHVNVPLIQDSLAARVAFRVKKTDPFLTNGCGNAPAFSKRQVYIAGSDDFTLEGAQICGESVETNSISTISPNLPTRVGDRGNWDLRGAIRWAPPGTDMDWLVNVHGGRLKQDSTLGQVVGTGDTGTNYGLETGDGYFEPDALEEYNDFLEEVSGFKNERALSVSGLPQSEVLANLAEARALLAESLTSGRPLDRKPYRGDYGKVGTTTRDTLGGYIRGEMPIGDHIEFSTITAFESYTRTRDSDSDFSPDVLFETVIQDRAKQFSQDFEFSGDLLDGSLRWKTGAALLEERLHNLAYTDLNISNLAPVRRSFVQDTTAYMAFAEFSVDFLEDFTLEVGARFNYEKKRFALAERTIALLGNQEGDSSDTWREPTGKISLTYHISDTSSVHAKYSRGYKAGHFNSNSLEESSTAARPEFIDSFEWGIKTSFFDRRLTASSSFFFYKYKDYQVFVFIDNPGFAPPQLVIRNAEAVQQYGAELEVEAYPLRDFVPEPLDKLKLQVRFGWVASEFLEFTNTVFRTNTIGQNFPVVIDYGGNQLINAPKFKVSGTVEWPFDFGEWGKITPRYDFEWSDDIFFDPNEGRGSLDLDELPVQPEYALGNKAWWIHNIRLTYQTPVENIRVSGWVRNLLDERVKSYAFDASFFAKTIINFVGDPRSAGVDLEVTW